MILRSISFRIWLIFTCIGILLSVPLANYYNQQQFEVLSNHTQKEFEVNAKITAKAVETALELDDYGILQSLLKEIESERNYEFVALSEISENGKTQLLACYPEEKKSFVLKPNESKFRYHRSYVKSDYLNGEIIIGSSNIRDILIGKELNKPLIFLTTFAILASIILFGLSVIFLSRPVFNAAKIANELGKKNYSIQLKKSTGKNEIANLNNSFYHLKENLVRLEEENFILTKKLENKIDEITNEIIEKNKLNSFLHEISTYLIENVNSSKELVLESALKSITKSLETEGAALLHFEESLNHHHLYHSNEKIDSDTIISIFDSNSERIEKNELIEISADSQLNNDQYSLLKSTFPQCNYFYFYQLSKKQCAYKIFLFSESSFIGKSHEDVTNTIKLFLSMLSNFLDSKRNEEEMKLLNKSLEQKVIEKTQQNLEISNSLVSHEKLIAVGELAAGIAHDLNTPLATIKASNENLEEILESFIPELNLIEKTDLLLINEINFKDLPSYKYLNALEKLKRQKTIETYLESLGSPSELASNFVDAGILETNSTLFSLVVRSSNQVIFLKILKQLILMKAFVVNVNVSVEKSTEIISNLSKFMREDLTQIKEIICPKQSIEVVLSLLRFRMKKDIRLVLDIPEDIKIYGIEMKLFQAWMNLIKNAIDALDQDTENMDKMIKISATRIDSEIIIEFENNGPMIPENIQHKIFKKFFTTKQSLNGTGLGLNIVQNIILEHYGSINLVSTTEKTIFEVRLPNAAE
jgi:signal transduction histidine kinase